MSFKLITAPTVEPVSLAEAKLHCKVDGTDDDTRLAILISAARSLAEQITGRAFAPQTWELVLDEFPDAFVLQHAPIVSITSLKYIDTTGVERTVDPSYYTLDLDSKPGYLVPAYGYQWPATQQSINAVRVRYACGHATADPALSALKMWMLLAVATWYKHAESTTEIKTGTLPRTYCDGLLDEYMVYA